MDAEMLDVIRKGLSQGTILMCDKCGTMMVEAKCSSAGCDGVVRLAPRLCPASSPDVEAATRRAAEKIRRVIYMYRNIHPDRTAAIIAAEFADLKARLAEAEQHRDGAIDCALSWMNGQVECAYELEDAGAENERLKAENKRLQLRIDGARTILRWGTADPQKTVIAAYRELDAAPAGPDKEEGK